MGTLSKDTPLKKDAAVSNETESLAPANFANEKKIENSPRDIAEGKPLEKPTVKTPGEKIYHFATYTGVGYALNLAVSLVIWDYFLNGKGKPALDKLGKTFGKIATATGAHPDVADQYAKTATNMAFSTMGGHLTMIPVKFMEDNARYLTHVANKAFYKDYEYKDLKAEWNAPCDHLPALVDEPTAQTWASIVARRAMGMAAVSASGTALNKFQGGKYQELLQNTTLKIADKGIELSGSQALQKLNQNPTFQRYMELAALDAYFTVITSAVTAVSKNWFGEGKDEAEEKKPEVNDPKKFVSNAAHQRSLEKNSSKQENTSFSERVPKKPLSKETPANYVDAVSKPSPGASMNV